MRIYQFRDRLDGEFVVNVVANNIKEAKKIAYPHEIFWDTKYINIQGYWMRGLCPEKLGLEVGFVEDQIGLIEGLKLGLYAYIEIDCPNCKKEITFYEEEELVCGCGYNWETMSRLSKGDKYKL